MIELNNSDMPKLQWFTSVDKRTEINGTLSPEKMIEKFFLKEVV